jgi:hypothetical protein
VLSDEARAQINTIDGLLDKSRPLGGPRHLIRDNPQRQRIVEAVVQRIFERPDTLPSKAALQRICVEVAGEDPSKLWVTATPWNNYLRQEFPKLQEMYDRRG